MSYSYPGSGHSQVLYQSDPHMLHSLKAIRDRVQRICMQHRNQRVRVETMDGHVYEGVLVGCGHGHVYLSVPSHGTHRALGSAAYYNNVILPLVLYELLVITLLYR